MIALQYKTFREQAFCAFFVYFPSLTLCAYKVNFNHSWKYDSNVILNNVEFNVATITVAISGILSLITSFRPNWTEIFR